MIFRAHENWANVHRLRRLWQSPSKPKEHVPISKSKPEPATIAATIIAVDGLVKRDIFSTFVPKWAVELS